MEIEFLRDLERLKLALENIEDVNARIDKDYMFNDNFIRGKKKMNMMLTITLIVMMWIAKRHIKNKQRNIRSLTKI